MIHRRTFLQRSALALTALRPGDLPTYAAHELIPARPVPFLGRAFELTAIYEAPNGNARADGLAIAPDSVHSVSDIRGGWVAIEHGWLPATALQPIAPYVRPPLLTHADAPHWAHVIAPSTPVQQWCDARAPITGSLGYGAVVAVRGTLTEDYGGVWYEIAAGWVRGLHCAPLDLNFPALAMPAGQPPAKHLTIDRRQRLLRLISDEIVLLNAPYYGGTDLDRLVALPNIPIGSVAIDQPGDDGGRAWLLWLTVDRHSAPIRVAGAWDHNRFGLSGGDSDLTIATDAAELLYRHLSEKPNTGVVKVMLVR